MVNVALALAVLFAVLAVLSWFLRAPPHNVARLLRRLAATVGIGVLIYLAATGRLHWLFVAIGSLFAFLPRLLPLLGYLPVVGRLYKRYKAARSATQGGGSGRTSEVETRYLRMQLNHDSGEIDGRIIAGRYQGRQLTELAVEQLLELRRKCLAEDEESARLVEAFLDRVHGDSWREQADASTGQHRQGPAPDSGTMSREEAYEILGLQPGAGEDEILAAHRRLMQKLHPDRGGSDYLAARINQAKERLLDK